MLVSKRLDLLGKGVFQRNDFRKHRYRFFNPQSSYLPLIDLSLGSSDLLPPKVVLSSIQDALYDSESSSYCLHSSTRPFREHVVAWVNRRLGVKVDPDKEVLLLVGSQEGTAHLPLALMDPGDSGLIIDPSYPSHRGGLVLAGAQIEHLLITSENSWRPDFSTITTTQWDQLRLMTFGFPHNPTAQVGEQSWLDEAMKIGLRHQVVIAHDNPYLDLAIEGEAPALLRSSGWRECGIEFFSFSKAWCMGGFRLAFAVGAEPVIAALRRVKGVIDFNQSLALQAGAVAALDEASEWPQQLLIKYRKRRDITLQLLQELGWEVPVPSMALYLWMPLPAWAVSKGWNDETFTDELLNGTGVALAPGSGFGLGGSGWLRLALVRPQVELKEAISRIRVWWNLYA